MPARATVCTVKGGSRVRAKLPAGEVRVRGFEEVEPTLSREEALAEAGRCAAASPCLYCETCQLLCPDLCIVRDEAGHIVIDLAYCKGCGLCAHYCPHGAIRMVVDE